MLTPIFFSLIFFATLPFVVSQGPDCDQSQYKFPIGELTKNNSLDRYFSLSTKSPVTRAIHSNKTLLVDVDPLYDLLGDFAEIIETRRRNNDSFACNLEIDSYIRSANRSMARRQFGAFFEELECPSRIDVEIAVQRNELTSKARDKAFETLNKGLEALFQATSSIDVIPETNWTKGTFRTFGIVRSQRSQDCTLNSMFAYRFNGKFFIRSGITNEPPESYVVDFLRQQVNEYVPREGTEALLGPHIRVDTECTFENSSTQLTKWGGRTPPGHGGNVDMFSRFGVFNLASRANEVAVDIAEDSLTGSNIAILALPMVMNFVPVALIAELSTVAMLFYVIFTDIFSTLPFMIKGIELIQTGNAGRKAMGVSMLGNSTLGQMEIFAADCRAKESYKTIGIVFVCIALALMVVGVWLELYASHIMKKRRQRGQDGPFGEALDFVGYGPVGGEPEDEKMRKFTYEMMVEEGIGARYARSSGSSESSLPRFPSRITNSLRTMVGRSRGGQGRSSRMGSSEARSMKKD